jgi:hypothetical protein
MKSYIWLYLLLLISILTYKYLFLNKKKSSTFWNTMPVMHFDSAFAKNMTIINNSYGFIMPDQSDLFLFDIQTDIPAITVFLNENYIDGYYLSEDYIFRKMSIKGSIGIICKINNTIIGFIQCSPYAFLDKTFGYVDLLCVSKQHRKKGLAKKLIENIIYYSPNKIFIHKKDKNALPFQHFYKTSHYTCGIAYLKNKYGIKNTLYKPLTEKIGTNDDIFITSDSIKTYYYNDKYISFAIHKFKTIGFIKIAEIFYISKNFNDYEDIIAIMHANNIDFMVTLPNGIFKNKIDQDYYSKSMDLYIYTFNYVLHPIQEELWFNIP